MRSINANEFILELNVKLLISYAIACKTDLISLGNSINVKQMSEINKISTMIIENLFEPPVLKDLAREAGMNETSFKKLFKNITQQPLYQYWSNCRMEAAFQKIISSSDSITDIALDFGFSTVTNFSKAFTKRYSRSPTAFRK